MPLTQKQKKTLRNLAHELKPVVMIGQHGLTDSVLNEIELSINHHELIKIKVNAGDREQRAAFIEQIAEHTQSELIHKVGHMAVFYRRNPDRKQIDPGKS
ncbi:MAG: ribosome assembly RNA-binding protein YhbY [Gammaproteobacteria bacterium]|nr:ribosome assembly RNA-binding protein YhbY [Gammaproteobacteria bacterium]